MAQYRSMPALAETFIPGRAFSHDGLARVPARTPMIGLRYFSLFGSSGYAQAARRYLTGLAHLGVPLTWTPMVPYNNPRVGYKPFEGRSVGDPELDPLCNKPIPYDVVLLHIMPEFYPALIEMVRGKRIAAYTVWETDRLPRTWRGFLKDVELLLIPCEWNRKIFETGGFEGPIEVVPHNLLPGQAPLPEPPRDRGEFVFYSINTWSDRKAVDLTLKAYLQAFTPADSVRLVLKTSPRHEMRRIPFTPLYPVRTQWLIAQILRKHRHPPPVTVITDFLPDDAMRDLHRQGDCYVSLTRSEGWGMGAFDAAASGRPVIMTGFGGQTEFLPPDLAYLVNFRLVKTPYRPMEQFERGHLWAEPDVRHAAQLMRHVFENRAESAAKARELAFRICGTYEHERVAGILLDALRKYF
jgi:glycosyltransferase involved in cell wall biosynthesis